MQALVELIVVLLKLFSVVVGETTEGRFQLSAVYNVDQRQAAIHFKASWNALV